MKTKHNYGTDVKQTGTDVKKKLKSDTIICQ